MRLHSLLLVSLLAASGGAQSVTTITGVVRDSIARLPLAGAVVQLVSADPLARGARATFSDSVGRFALGGVPDGRYLLGFFHPMLDSLGLEPTLREVRVAGQASVVADLGIPSPTRLGAALCGTPAAPESGAVVIGSVRNARDGEGIASVTVAAEWFEPSVSREGITRRLPRLAATTAANGWFAICNVPRSGIIALVANRGADSTDRVEVEVPAHGFLRRELYLGPARRSAVADQPTRGASAAMRSSMLDTVKVTAARARDVGIAGFAERRRIGLGRFLTTEDISRRAPVVTSDLFRQVPGIRMEAGSIRMRGLVEGECTPRVYLDGRYMNALSPVEIDDWVRPEEVAGIEIYVGGNVPSQFQEALAGCGSIVIWTRPRLDTPDASSWRGRLARVLGVTALAVTIGMMVHR
jgi:hypothetical protein